MRYLLLALCLCLLLPLFHKSHRVIYGSVAPAAVGDGWWHTQGNTIRDAVGNIVRFSGVNWHGFDSENRIMHGLWGGTNRSIENHLDEMKTSGFNLIRLPFSSDIFAPGAKPSASAIDPVKNADLLPLTCLQLLDRVVASAGQRGIRIILDYHRLVGGAASENGRWYDATHSEASWIANWKALVARYKDNRRSSASISSTKSTPASRGRRTTSTPRTTGAGRPSAAPTRS